MFTVEELRQLAQTGAAAGGQGPGDVQIDGSTLFHMKMNNETIAMTSPYVGRYPYGAGYPYGVGYSLLSGNSPQLASYAGGYPVSAKPSKKRRNTMLGGYAVPLEPSPKLAEFQALESNINALIGIYANEGVLNVSNAISALSDRMSRAETGSSTGARANARERPSLADELLGTILGPADGSGRVTGI